MKTILHPDYWVEVPAGEFLAGLSPKQEEVIAARRQEQMGWDNYPLWKAQLIKKFPVAKLESQTQWLDTYYISRFPITEMQYGAFRKGSNPSEIPGCLEEPVWVKSTTKPFEYRGRNAAMVLSPTAQEFCKALGARLPTSMEWEKAARGTDGRLYPWGDNWDMEMGFFIYYIEHKRGLERVVDAFPGGASPYGVWAMVGTIPQLIKDAFPYPFTRGCEPAETTSELAWLDNIVPFAYKCGDYVALRPVLDKWPVQQWRGHKVNNE